MATLARPLTRSALTITNRSFRYAAPCLWNDLFAVLYNNILIFVCRMTSSACFIVSEIRILLLRSALQYAVVVVSLLLFSSNASSYQQHQFISEYGL